MAPRRTLPPLLAVALLAGCTADDGIRHYQVARATKPATRLLAAIAPAGEKIWFFKLAGPAPAVAERIAEWEQFVRSLRFDPKAEPPVKWTLPEGWRETSDKPQALRYATIRVGPEALELSVTPLGQEAAGLLGNVNRWRGQIGLKPVTEAELGAITREDKVNDVSIKLVDMTGEPGGVSTRSTPPSMQPAVADAPGSPPLTYDTPPGWEPQPPSSFRVASFRVRDAEVSVTPFPGPAGGLLANVNRWRKEVNLGDVTEEQLRKESKTIDVAGDSAVSVDLVGPESDGPKRQRTLGVIQPRGGHTWFFKMRGPADLVAKQQAAFEAFVRSVRFPGAKP